MEVFPGSPASQRLSQREVRFLREPEGHPFLLMPNRCTSSSTRGRIFEEQARATVRPGRFRRDDSIDQGAPRDGGEKWLAGYRARQPAAADRAREYPESRHVMSVMIAACGSHQPARQLRIAPTGTRGGISAAAQGPIEDSRRRARSARTDYEPEHIGGKPDRC